MSGAAPLSAGIGAIVLAGGRGSRLAAHADDGSPVEKAAVELAGERLLDRVTAAAAHHGAHPIIAVGREGSAHASRVVCEDPPFAGPLAGLAAGLAAIDSASLDAPAAPAPATPTSGSASPAEPKANREPEWALVLSCDLVDPGAVCTQLIEALAARLASGDSDTSAESPGFDGVLLVDPDGRTQWLAGIYRVARLREALAAIAEPLTNLPLRLAFAGSQLQQLAAPFSVTRDIDTPEDLRLAREHAADLTA